MNRMHGIIFAYETRTELRELVENRVQGSVPFGGNYRMVDFILSDMVAAGMQDVGVILQGKCQSMLDHLGSGRSWDLSRNHGGLTLLPAFAYSNRAGVVMPFRGKVEALGCMLDYVLDIRQEYVVLADSDVVLNLPLDEVLDAHIASGADMTVVCTARPGDASDTYFKLGPDGRILDTAYGTANATGVRCLNLCLIRRDLLVQVVKDCMAHNEVSFRRDILQKRGKTMDFRAYMWNGYAERINNVREYYSHSMDLLDPAVRADLLCPERPVLAKDNDSPASYVDPEGESVNCLLADGCDIQGHVENSIFFRGVQIEKGADVQDCILFKGTVVRAGVTLRHVITDKYVEIQPNRTLMGHADYPLVIARGSKV
jgi:glucose-1-phosphate adenylyltransferase